MQKDLSSGRSFKAGDGFALATLCFATLTYLRTGVRLLHRSNREETAEPLLSRHERLVFRDGGLQPRLPLLPELGHLKSAGDGPGK
jgi:hypothetical protein